MMKFSTSEFNQNIFITDFVSVLLLCCKCSIKYWSMSLWNPYNNTNISRYPIYSCYLPCLVLHKQVKVVLLKTEQKEKGRIPTLNNKFYMQFDLNHNRIQEVVFTDSRY